MPGSGSRLEILLIEDSDTDVRLFEMAMGKARFPANLNVVKDGGEALRYLRREGAAFRAVIPDIIVLDWNLPLVNGVEVLREIRADSDLADIPVIVFTTSKDQEDMIASYELCANCYMTKPSGLREYLKIFDVIEELWLRLTGEIPGD
ncbi:response regulator [Pelagicoccus sp. SDUM812003]|uniref:response regulator n=1 Tax=Pelagicoccus sp. SDUM812003 TaxID=3041267 RepID=UPI00280F0690|nr:response regulator [Pelagicoccus sp. SDUM812003]MDQ8205360.1 response regulator [Pelagicoccus sp. SDUM812003]